MADENNNNDDVIHLDEAKQQSSFKSKIKAALSSIKSLFSSLKDKLALSKGIVSKIPKVDINKEKLKDKKILFPLIGGGILFLILIIWLLMPEEEKPLEVVYQPKVVQTPAPSFNASTTLKPMAKSELQDLITKASVLYNSGQIAEALDVYSNISVFSQSFANFNLGVAKLNLKQYKESMNAFNNVISSGENVAAAAINAGVAAYKNNDMKMYDYYINLAKGTMIDWYDKPLYSYLYSLTNFYSMNYFAMLSSLNNTTSSHYPTQNANLLAKIYLNFNDDYNALKALLDSNDGANNLAIALLYARMGEYDLASERLNSLIGDEASNPQAQMALALVNLKRSQFMQSANIYDNLRKNYDAKELSSYYPIKVKLQDSLFDINIIQKNFWKRTDSQNRVMHYKILFYFAPFRVFDVNEAISMIREGGLNLRMNNIEEARNVLLSGVMLSRINSNITQGLKEILNYNINEALNIMKAASNTYPNHNVLQYNLGLLYAQLDDFDNARKHFLKAYHLDSNDILSGIFALMCIELTSNTNDRILSEVNASIDNATFKSSIQEGFYRSMLGFVNGNSNDDMLWFDRNNERSTLTPMMYALNAIYTLSTRDKAAITKAFEDLSKATNNDMVALILARIASHYNENIKSFSLNLFDFFKNELKDLDLVYAGPSLARQIYIYMAFLVGANSYVDTILNDRLLNSKDDVVGILQALALNSIYMLDFERAFAYYNSLIDDYKIINSQTYFYAAVAAIGAGHYDNAVALIQLSRMESGANFEARYALGLLYQAMGNLQLAALQFAKITNTGFRSEFFDFEIDTSKIVNQ